MPEGADARVNLRLAELIASLTLAMDLGLGQPMEHVLHATLTAVRLGEALGLGGEDLSVVYYLALLRYVGCTAEAHRTAAVLGDELDAYTWLIAADQGRPAIRPYPCHPA